MRSGDLDRRITLQKVTETTVSGGGIKSTWDDYVTIWASRLSITGGEKLEDAEILATAQYKFKIRYRDDLNPKMRVSYAGRIYDILVITENGRNESMWILAKQNISQDVN